MKKHSKPLEIGNRFGKRRPLGSRNKGPQAARKLLAECDVPLMKKCISSALQGDMKAMQMLMERFTPCGRLTVSLKLQEIQTVEGTVEEYSAITRALAKDVCSAAERQALANLLKARLELINFHGFEARLLKLEKLQKRAA
jgi:hypothetical protein